MHDFSRKQKALYCEDVALEELADTYGTPLYVYSYATLARHYKLFSSAFSSIAHRVCFSVKANASLGILKLLAELGSGADIVSGGELFRALAAGIPPRRIVYSGVGKTASEIKQALEADILMFNVESSQELEVLSRIAGQVNQTARIALRVNPDVDLETHPYVATGLKTSKFGISFENALPLYRRAATLPNVDVVGIDCHIGSQLTDLLPFVHAARKLRSLIATLRSEGIDIQYLDFGGGLGITYDAEDPPSAAEYGQVICEALNGETVTLILEPGRKLAGNAGILLTRVLYTKINGEKRFVIVDAGMNDLIRPSLYDAYHDIVPVVDEARKQHVVDVVGPVCENGDFLARNRALPRVEPGELLATMSAGAYGFSMASTYNSRPLPAEVVISGDTAYLIRERGTNADLVRGETFAKIKAPPNFR